MTYGSHNSSYGNPKARSNPKKYKRKASDGMSKSSGATSKAAAGRSVGGKPLGFRQEYKQTGKIL